jgi:hypothetical protein
MSFALLLAFAVYAYFRERATMMFLSQVGPLTLSLGKVPPWQVWSISS